MLTPDPPYSSKSLSLYSSYAITTNSCINVFPPTPNTNCGKNNYSYHLYSCIDDAAADPPLICAGDIITSHQIGNICIEQDVRLNFCSKGSVSTRYMCVIYDGPNPPTEDVYIEWHWIAEYDISLVPPPTSTKLYTTGKFIFVASAAYIQRQYQVHGYGGISGSGIGMFNPSNHNP